MRGFCLKNQYLNTTMTRHTCSIWRRFLTTSVCVALFGTTNIFAADKIVVLTSYPQEVVAPFEAAFEAAYPQYRLEILWRQSRDALRYLQNPHLPVDVYWTPAQHNFAFLAAANVFRSFPQPDADLPSAIGGFQISDPQDRYRASEVAGYGMVYDPGALKRLGLPVPRDWKTLADPAFSGHVVLPIPSKVGYAPMLYDTLIQSYGWETGWALLQQIASNAELSGAGATFISDDIGTGDVAVGATIDFFAASAIAKGQPIEFAYPQRVGFSPAHVAMMNESTQPTGAMAFALFVLSDTGQKILFHPNIRKLPVRPSVYAHMPEGYFDPFASAKRADYPYDVNAGLARVDLVSAMFDALLTRAHVQLQSMWNILHQAEKKHPGDPRLADARMAANYLPVSSIDANAPVLQALFSQRSEKTTALEAQWDAAIHAHYAQAEAMARAILEDNAVRPADPQK